MSETSIERKIIYTYGPDDYYEGGVRGFYTWEQLKSQIEDDRWRSPYTIVCMEEREVTWGEWTEVDVPE